MTSDLHRLPTACGICDRTWLAPPSVDQLALCPFCNEPARVVPGETYRADDVALFERIEKAIHRAQLSELATRKLWATLSNVSERGRQPDLLLQPIFDAMPALGFVEDLFAADRAQLSQAIGMILAIISAHLHVLEARQTTSAGVAEPLR